MPMFGRPATVARGKYKLFTFPLPTQNGSSMKTLSWTPCCSIGSLSWVRRICFPLYHCSARGEVMLLMEVFVLTASLSSVITATDPLHTDSGRWRDSEMFWQQKYTTLLMGVIANIIDDAIVHNIWVQTFKIISFQVSTFDIAASFDPSESCKADHHTVHNVYCSLLPLLHLYFSIQQTVFLRLISFMQLCFRSSPEHYNIMAPSLIKITADPPSVFISEPRTLLKVA